MAVSRATFEEIIDRIHTVPSLPEVVTQVVKLVNDPNSDARQINVIMMKDAAMSAKMLRMVNSVYYGLAEPGKIIHEVGTARMGNDPKTSVLNSNCQAHDVKNLFVADAAPFVSQGDKNATWTILALSARTSNYIIEQKKMGVL